MGDQRSLIAEILIRNYTEVVLVPSMAIGVLLDGNVFRTLLLLVLLPGLIRSGARLRSYSIPGTKSAPNCFSRYF